MKTINLTRKRFESLDRYELPDYVFNTEGKLYVLPIKSRWNTQIKLLKRLYQTNGDTFGNKLLTINSLNDNREIIDMEDEIIFPEELAIVGGEIVGFTTPLWENTINLLTALKSSDISNDSKINYLKQIGAILEKMKLRREYTQIKDFFLNDLHESNFIVDPTTNKLRVVDVDSSKINGNQIFPSKYLSSKSFISEIYKYQKNGSQELKYYRYGEDKYPEGYNRYPSSMHGAFIPDENTDLYCYMMVILNFLYEDNIQNFTIQEFYEYIEYLYHIGISAELISYFEKMVSGSPNENPYELLDELLPFVGRSNHYVYEHIRKKSSK